MKIYNPTIKVYRLDINKELLKNSVGFANNEIVPEIYPASDGLKDACRFGYRISSSFRQKDTGIEIIGYLFEYFADFVFEGKDKDREDIKRFIENALLNHENAFLENKPIGVIFSNFIINPDIERLTDDVIQNFQFHGYYSE